MSIATTYAQVTPNNRAISPVSINYILAALGYGSSGQAQADLMRIFNITDKQGFLQYLTMARQALGDVRNAAMIVVDGQMSIIGQQYYDAMHSYVEMGSGDFRSPEFISNLNQWIERNSGFPNVVTPEMVRGIIMIIVSTLWFTSNWRKPFTITEQEPFTRADGSSTQVPMMRQTNEMSYYMNGGVEAVALSFEDGSLAEFAMGLPANSSFDRSFSYSKGEVSLGLPRFGIDEMIDLDALLQGAGLSSIYQANFPDIHPLFRVQQTLQRIFVEVNEKGAEVRAVTLTTMMPTAPPSPEYVPPMEITFNQPFHFRIRKGSVTLVDGYYNGN